MIIPFAASRIWLRRVLLGLATLLILWPNALFRWITVCPRFKRSVAIVVRDLSVVK